jgi:hypothetical protein
MEAEIGRDTNGVISFDSLIDRNLDQLWLYFMTYLNEKPKLNVCIHGHYTEVRFYRRISTSDVCIRINFSLIFCT